MMLDRMGIVVDGILVANEGLFWSLWLWALIELMSDF
jgi:hypothetical protein